MSGAGRPPNPIGLHVVDKAHAHRYKDIDELKPKKKRPKAPEFLSVRAKHVFDEFVDTLEEMGIATESDMQIYIMYANNQEELEYLEDFLRRNGHSYEVEGRFNSTFKKRPESEVYKQCKDLKFKILAEFGLTPASRRRVKIEKQKEKPQNPFAMLDSAQEG